MAAASARFRPSNSCSVQTLPAKAPTCSKSACCAFSHKRVRSGCHASAFQHAAAACASEAPRWLPCTMAPHQAGGAFCRSVGARQEHAAASFRQHPHAHERAGRRSGQRQFLHARSAGAAQKLHGQMRSSPRASSSADQRTRKQAPAASSLGSSATAADAPVAGQSWP